MRIVFMGSPDFAVPTLDALHHAGHEIVAVYAQPPRPAGRGKASRPTAVHSRADALGLSVHTPSSLRNPEAQALFASHQADVAVVAAYGLILPRPILDAPRYGCLNVHASLLPRWRGAAPVQRAIMAGDTQTGVTIMQMEEGLDTGPMLDVQHTAIDGKTAGELTNELAHMGAQQMVEIIARIPDIIATPQPDQGATYASKIKKDEARLDFSLPAPDVERLIRAFNPMPGAFCTIEGERVKILRAAITEREADADVGTILDTDFTIACGKQAIRPLIVQRQGKAAMETSALLRGWSITPGTQVQ